MTEVKFQVKDKAKDLCTVSLFYYLICINVKCFTLYIMSLFEQFGLTQLVVFELHNIKHKGAKVFWFPQTRVCPILESFRVSRAKYFAPQCSPKYFTPKKSFLRAP